MASLYQPFENLPPLDLGQLIGDLRELAKWRDNEGGQPLPATQGKARDILAAIEPYILAIGERPDDPALNPWLNEQDRIEAQERYKLQCAALDRLEKDAPIETDGLLRAIHRSCSLVALPEAERRLMDVAVPTADDVKRLADRLSEVARIAKPSSADSNTAGDARTTRDANVRTSLEARALAILTDHPDWTDTRISQELGCNRTSLYRLDKFTAARQLLERGGIASQPHGSKADGSLEAWDAD